jgi:hypothetical protein
MKHLPGRAIPESPSTSLERARDNDPFAGDDEQWAPEDQPADVAVEGAVNVQDALEAARFFRGLLVALAIAAVGWFALIAVAYAALTLIT